MERKTRLQKLHKKFAHPTAERLIKLLKESAKVKDDELFGEIKKITESCEFCKKHKKSAPRPTVGLPLSTKFNEVVAMDLKMLSDGTWFLHCIDTLTRFSVATTVESKNREEIITKLFRFWISVFGAPIKYFSDNGGEFNNYEFQSMCENLNITVKTTAAEAPWSNGMCERHNGILGNMAEKVMAQTGCNAEIAICWATNAKNSLVNVYGFSPYQLVFGKNPNIPGITAGDRLPALSGSTSSKIVMDHLNALHTAREAFIKAETSERLRRALRGKVYTGSHARFLSGDQVYYKRDNSKEWHGPAPVLGQDGTQVLIKSGGMMVRVHSCKVILKETSEELMNTPERKEKTLQTEQQLQGLNSSDDEISSDEEDDNEEKNEKELTENHEDSTQQNDTEQETGIEDENNNENWSTVLRRDDNTGRSLKKDDQIRYKNLETDEWKYGTVLGPGGRTRGLNKDYFNIKSNDEATADFGMNIEKMIVERKDQENIDSNEEEPHITSYLSGLTSSEIFETFFTIIPTVRHNEVGVREAKEKEINNWKAFNVFEEVLEPKGEQIISTKWIITQKTTGEFKARLVVRGDQEEDVTELPSDSPTVNKTSLRIFLTLSSLKDWSSETMDVRAAFLQGKEIDRTIYIRPPVDQRRNGYVWLLKRTVYGLGDAARNWFLTVRDELLKLGCVQSIYDKAVFMYYQQKKLEGLFVMHVDDFIYCGRDRYMENVIKGIRRKFDIGNSKCKNFVYLGWEMTQDRTGVTISQQEYASEVACAVLSPKRRQQKEEYLNEQEIKQYQSLLGKLNWIACQTRPDIKFDVLERSLFSKHPTVQDLLNLNKIVKKLHEVECKIFLPRLDESKELKLVVYSDASHANLADGVSSGRGHVIFLSDGWNCSVLSWASNKINRVVKSTLAAEGLSLLEALEEAIYLRVLISEMLYKDRNDKSIGIYAYTDNKSLYESIYSTKQASEKLLRIELAAIEQMINKQQVNSVEWVSTVDMLADALKKKGVVGDKLIACLHSGRF